MIEYRFRLQTCLGICLLVLAGITIFLPAVNLNNKEKSSVSRLYFAKWALTVNQDYDFSGIQEKDVLQSDTMQNDANSILILRLWGWLIYTPFLSVIVSIVFMFVRRRTFAGILLTDGILMLVCEIINFFVLPYEFQLAGESNYITFLLYIILAIVVVTYSILCMTIFHEKNSKKKINNKYDYVFQEKPDVWLAENAEKKVSVRAVGILKGISGEYAGQSLEIHVGEEIVLGRDPQYCMLVFNNPGVSRRHCGIRYDNVNGYYQAIDYSSNGTTLSDGTLLTTSEYTAIKPGTMLYIANGSETLMLM